MTFGVNTSPFAGKEGKWGTSRNLRERLFEELRTNVALRVEETESAENFLVSGRGELHLGILIETMRREGYEFQVSRPEVIFHKADDGALLEPYEEVHIETSNETVGAVVEMLGPRRGQMMDMQDAGQGMTRMIYIAPTRGLLGFRYQFLTSTRGAGVMHTIFHGYDEMAGPMSTRTTGSLVAWEAGETTAYALKNAEERGTLFYGPGVSVYEGMVVGECSRSQDMPINVCKKKHLTNVRSSRGDMEIRLTPPRQMSLDEAIEYLADDELLEVTPESYRIRKRILDTEGRGKQTKKIKEQLEEAQLQRSRKLRDLSLLGATAHPHDRAISCPRWGVSLYVILHALISRNVKYICIRGCICRQLHNRLSIPEYPVTRLVIGSISPGHCKIKGATTAGEIPFDDNRSGRRCTGCRCRWCDAGDRLGAAGHIHKLTPQPAASGRAFVGLYEPKVPRIIPTDNFQFLSR
jgi:hypothetical protein